MKRFFFHIFGGERGWNRGSKLENLGPVVQAKNDMRLTLQRKRWKKSALAVTCLCGIVVRSGWSRDWGLRHRVLANTDLPSRSTGTAFAGWHTRPFKVCVTVTRTATASSAVLGSHPFRLFPHSFRPFPHPYRPLVPSQNRLYSVSGRRHPQATRHPKFLYDMFYSDICTRFSQLLSGIPPTKNRPHDSRRVSDFRTIEAKKTSAFFSKTKKNVLICFLRSRRLG